MSNIEKATSLLQAWADAHGANINMYYAVKELKRQGLLMPDLPEPEVIRTDSRTKFWFDENIYSHEDSRKVRVIADDARFPVDEAREFALAILAACDYAETEEP